MDALRIVQDDDDRKIAGRMNTWLDASGMSIAEAARQIGTGVSQATLSTWLRGIYKGDNAAVAERVGRWLDTQEEMARSGTAPPQIANHVSLGVTEEIQAALSYAQACADVVLIHGRSGAGKTQALRMFRSSRSGVHLVTVTAAVATVAGLLARVSMAVDAGATHHSAAAAEAAIIARLEGRSALLMVDEAHHLSSRLLDELRCIRDVSQCGLALAGSDELWANLAGNRRCEQIVGRVGLRVSLGAVPETDIRILAAAMLGRTAKGSELKAIRNSARGAGGLHAMRRRLTRAHMIARAAGREEISAGDVARAGEH